MSLRILNDTSLDPDDLARLSNWVLSYVQPDGGALLFVSRSGDDYAGQHGVMVGIARPMAGWMTDQDEKHAVEVFVPEVRPASIYPLAQQTEGGPVVTLLNWKEEFVHTLAHELRHLDQYGEGRAWHGAEAEADCEHFAWGVTQAFRLHAAI